MSKVLRPQMNSKMSSRFFSDVFCFSWMSFFWMAFSWAPFFLWGVFLFCLSFPPLFVFRMSFFWVIFLSPSLFWISFRFLFRRLFFGCLSLLPPSPLPLFWMSNCFWAFFFSCGCLFSFGCLSLLSLFLPLFVLDIFCFDVFFRAALFFR